MPDLTALDAALRSQLTRDAFEGDATRYAIEGSAPPLAVSPTNQIDVPKVLAAANESDAALVPWGGGTQQALGMPPQRYDLALDLRRLDCLVEYEPTDLTVTVEAGMALSKLQKVLGEHGQWLPLEPPLPESATVGGILATNASGASRYRYGTARDLLIGVTFALPSGGLVKSGGRVVKNVAGYDLGKLQIGALGTLGVITQATFKVAPLPARTASVSARGSLTALMSICARIAQSLLAVQAMTLAKPSEEPDWSLEAEFAGGPGAVDRSLREFQGYVAEAGARSADSWRPSVTGVLAMPCVVRGSVVPSAVPAVCEAFVRHGAAVIAYPTAGIVYGAWEKGLTTDVLTALRRLCVETGRGALVLERAPLEVKRAVGEWGEPRADFELMRRVKAELDPKAILNPGRYLGGI